MIDRGDHFGIHWDRHIAWLLQGGKAHNFVGLKGSPPIEVPKGFCNHKVSTAAPIPDHLHWDYFMKMFPDPLVQALLPVPKEGGQNLVYVSDPYDDLGLYLATLSRLSSPIRSIIKPIWTLKMKDLEKELNTTNIQPLILVQADQKSQATIDTIGKLGMYIPRSVVITGAPEVVVRSPIQRVTTEIRGFEMKDLTTLPLENIGATLIRRYARGEDLDAPWETREDHRHRKIRERSHKH